MSMNYFVEKCKTQAPPSFCQIFPANIFQHFCDTARVVVGLIIFIARSRSLYAIARLSVVCRR